ncbi:nucleolar protein dao-5-like isoform X2 [Mya arenaria]|nr:nucleolar protein dao-5-like isoform X2 [Mya arenaria]
MMQRTVLTCFIMLSFISYVNIKHPHTPLLVDDEYGFHDMCYNESEIQTSNLDCLADGGFGLENDYAQPLSSSQNSQLPSGSYQMDREKNMERTSLGGVGDLFTPTQEKAPASGLNMSASSSDTSNSVLYADIPEPPNGIGEIYMSQISSSKKSACDNLASVRDLLRVEDKVSSLATQIAVEKLTHKRSCSVSRSGVACLCGLLHRRVRRKCGGSSAQCPVDKKQKGKAVSKPVTKPARRRKGRKKRQKYPVKPPKISSRYTSRKPATLNSRAATPKKSQSTRAAPKTAKSAKESTSKKGRSTRASPKAATQSKAPTHKKGRSTRAASQPATPMKVAVTQRGLSRLRSKAALKAASQGKHKVGEKRKPSSVKAATPVKKATRSKKKTSAAPIKQKVVPPAVKDRLNRRTVNSNPKKTATAGKAKPASGQRRSEPAAKPTPAKKAVNRTPVKPTPAKKAVNKTPVKPTPAKKAVNRTPVKPTTAKKAVNRTPVKPTPAKKAVNRTPVKPTPAKKAVNRTPVKPTPAKKAVNRTPVKPTPAKKAVNRTPVKLTPAKKAVNKTPVKPTPAKKAVNRTPVKLTPAKKGVNRTPVKPQKHVTRARR